MSRKTLKIKGTGVPRICTWILGFVHGRILKTAVLDSETGYICSCYLINKWKLFEQYSFERVKKLFAQKQPLSWQRKHKFEEILKMM